MFSFPVIRNARHARAALVFTGLLFTGHLAGCGDDLYDSGTCQVSQLPSGQSKVECENGDTLIIGDVVADGTCTLRPEPDGSSILRCDGDDYVIPATPAGGQSYTCSVVNQAGSETVSCQELVRPIPGCPAGISGQMVLGAFQDDWGDWGGYAHTKDTFLRYGCTAFTGLIVIEGALDAVDLEVMRRIEKLSGTLAVGNVESETIEFEHLTSGTPRIEVMSSDSLKALRFPLLTGAATIQLAWNESLEVIDFSSVESIEFTLELTALPEFRTALFPNLATVEAIWLQELGLNLEALSFPALNQLDELTAASNELSVGFSFPSLASVRALYFENNAALDSIVFSSLTTAGNVVINGNGGAFSVDFASLTSIDGLSLRDNDGLQALNAPVLQTVHAEPDPDPDAPSAIVIEIDSNPALTAINLPKLVNLRSLSVLINANDLLETIALDALATIGVLSVTSNSSLTLLNAPALIEADELTIAWNAALAQCRVAVIVDGLLSDGAVLVEGNDDAQECPPEP